MPQTSAVTLLPPTPVATTSTPSYTPASDGSFQQSLQSAQQRQSTPAAKPTDKSPKKITKRAKSSKIPTTTAANPGKPKTNEPSTSDDAVTESADSPQVPEKSPDEKEKSLPSAPANIPTTITAAVPLNVTPITKPQAPDSTNEIKAPDRKPAVVKNLNPDQSKSKNNEDGNKDAPIENAPDTEPTATPAVASSATDAAPSPTVKPAGFCTDTPETSATDAKATPQPKSKPTPVPTDSAQLQELSDVLPTDNDPASSPHDSNLTETSPLSSNFEQQLQRALTPLAPKAPAPPAPAPEAQFADANHPSIITGVHSELLPNGGTMQIRLDPPDLGALQVTVHMRDGVMTAAFETSNDQATRMLSHSLSQLKTTLELSGISVEKMHVQQFPRQESRGSSSNDPQQQSQDPQQQQQARQDQQRRQMLQRMWNKLAGKEDPLDLVA